MDAELNASGIEIYAALPYYGPDGQRNDGVRGHRLPLCWVVSQGFWDRYLAPLIGEGDTLQVNYGGWPVYVGAGAGEWVHLEEERVRTP